MLMSYLRKILERVYSNAVTTPTPTTNAQGFIDYIEMLQKTHVVLEKTLFHRIVSLLPHYYQKP